MAIKKNYELAVTIQYDDTTKKKSDGEYRWYDSSGFRISKEGREGELSHDSILVNHSVHDFESYLEDLEEFLDQAKQVVKSKREELSGE